MPAELIHDVDLELLRRARYTGAPLNWSDRRTDVYKLEYRVEDEVTEV